jgi:heme exporter protein A
MIHVRGLVKSFGDHVVLDSVDLEVREGESLALIGPNGAGKTTLLRILATLSRPSAGAVRVAGADVDEESIAVRRQIGFLAHEPLLYDDLSARGNLRFYGRMYDVPNLDEQVAALLLRVGLERFQSELVRTFSRGMKQRLAIARALLHDPALLLLDEPYTGLDSQAAGMLDAVLKEAAGSSRTVILTTHSLERGLRICRRVALLIQGRIVEQMEAGEGDVERLGQVYARYAPGSQLA